MFDDIFSVMQWQLIMVVVYQEYNVCVCINDTQHLHTSMFFTIRFKVQDERFVDTTPTGPKDHEASSGTDLTPGPKIAPYTIIVSVVEFWLFFDAIMLLD